MKKILLIGGMGLLGKQLIHDLHAKYDITATYHRYKSELTNKVKWVYLDVCDKKSIPSVIGNEHWDLVLHTASIGDVDYCEGHKKESYRVNVEAIKNIVLSTLKNNIKLIYFSTNAIYDGKKGFYSERSRPNPINYYGKTKLEGERIIKKLGKDYIILRLNTMFGWNDYRQRVNPSVWIINSLRKKKKIKVVNDIYNTHLWVGFVSQIVERLSVQWTNREIVNIGGNDCMDRYSFAITIAKVFKLNRTLITPVKNSYFPGLAPRPLNTCFDTSKLQCIFNISALSTIQGLKEMKKQENEKQES